MTEKIPIEISLHPLAWKVLREQYHHDGKAVDVGHGWLYSMIVQGLERQHIFTPRRDLSRFPKGMVKGHLYIYYEDFLRYGRYMRLPRQANISRVIYRMERERICRLVATLHVATGIERNKIMRQILQETDLTEDEMSFEALKKYYQRNYRQKEENIMLLMKELKV